MVQRALSRNSEPTEETARFRLLVEAVTDDAIYMLETSGIVTSWNAGAQRIKSYEASEIVGRHFSGRLLTW